MTTKDSREGQGDNAMLLRELAAVKAHFQLRAVAAVIGAPMPKPPHSEPSQ